jgi:hypothetical protein
MNLTMEDRKPPWAAGLYVLACVVPNQRRDDAVAEPKGPSFQAAVFADAVMHKVKSKN